MDITGTEFHVQIENVTDLDLDLIYTIYSSAYSYGCGRYGYYQGQAQDIQDMHHQYPSQIHHETQSNLFPFHTQAPQVSHHVPHPGPHQVPYAQFQINLPQSHSYFNPVPSCLSLNTSPTSPIPSLSSPNPVPLPTPMTSTPR